MRPVDTEVTIEQIIEQARAANEREQELLRRRSSRQWSPGPASNPATVAHNYRLCDELRKSIQRRAQLIDALVEAERGHCWGHHLDVLRGEAELARRVADECATSFEWADYQTRREAESVGYAMAVARTLTTLVDSLEPAHGE